jgi:hypothetical protein
VYFSFIVFLIETVTGAGGNGSLPRVPLHERDVPYEPMKKINLLHMAIIHVTGFCNPSLNIEFDCKERRRAAPKTLLGMLLRD